MAEQTTGSLQSLPYCEVIPGGPVVGELRPPGSKSLTNRALICAALARGASKLTGALQSEDTEVMIAALEKLGIAVVVREGGEVLEIAGRPTREDAASSSQRMESLEPMELYVANSGTTIRFLAAALSAIGGKYRLSGVPRMHQRPIGDLAAALRQLGCRAETVSDGGCPPLLIESDGWQCDRVEVAGSISSQYLSGLLMAAPAAQRDVTICVQGELVSRPYVEMTLALMADFGATVTAIDEATFKIHAADGYRGREYAIEPDASAASYPWSAAAITGGKVTVQGLTMNALQGDVHYVRVLEQMGCQVEESSTGITVSGRADKGIDVDMNAISDCVQSLAVVALFAEGTTRIRGVSHNRFKETDRIADLVCELRKLGAEVVEYEDGMEIHPRPLHGAVLETYHDHRMAMSLALAGLVVPGVQVTNPACTVKTYPNYFADLERLLGRAHRWGAV